MDKHKMPFFDRMILVQQILIIGSLACPNLIFIVLEYYKLRFRKYGGKWL